MSHQKLASKFPTPEQLAAVSDLPQDEQREIVARAKAIRAAKTAAHRARWEARIIALSNRAAPLPRDRRWPVLLADPPYPFTAYDASGLNRSTERHYPTLSIEEICALPVADLAIAPVAAPLDPEFLPRAPWAEWESLVKTKAGIGKSRASELMLIADGTKTPEQVRADTAERTAKTRALQSSPLRSGENADDPGRRRDAERHHQRAADDDAALARPASPGNSQDAEADSVVVAPEKWAKNLRHWIERDTAGAVACRKVCRKVKVSHLLEDTVRDELDAAIERLKQEWTRVQSVLKARKQPATKTRQEREAGEPGADRHDAEVIEAARGTGNGSDPEQSAERRKAEFAALEQGARDDGGDPGDIPDFLRRSP